MKKLILLFLITGCGYAPINVPKKSIIITTIEYETDGLCNYYGKGDTYSVTTCTSWNFKFTDSCGKFQIGDTLKIVKK